jgi:hypothetical protein
MDALSPVQSVCSSAALITLAISRPLARVLVGAEGAIVGAQSIYSNRRSVPGTTAERVRSVLISRFRIQSGDL